MFVVVFLQFMEQGAFVFAGVDVVETPVHQIVGDVADSYPNVEEGKQDGILEIEDLAQKFVEEGEQEESLDYGQNGGMDQSIAE